MNGNSIYKWKFPVQCVITKESLSLSLSRHLSGCRAQREKPDQLRLPESGCEML